MHSPGQGNLPAEVTSFVGRKAELDEARALLPSTRLLTLTGSGGVGKTRLAKQIGAEERQAFRDGVWFVDLTDITDGGLLPSVIGSRLGLFHSPTETVDDLAKHLRGRHVMLVVDNCEHLLEPVAVLLHDLLAAAPELRVVATSRQVLGVPGERVFPIVPLAVSLDNEAAPSRDGTAPVRAASPAIPDAVLLFADRAKAALPGFAIDTSNQDLLYRICHRLEGIPLAIELAATRLRAFSLETILERLDGAVGALASTLRTTPKRHRTLESTVAWSFGLCSAPEQVLWTRLSVFTDGIAVDAVEDVCSGGPIVREQIFDLLAGLVDKSILARQGGSSGATSRLTMLGLLRDFGIERLRECGEEMQFRRNHLDYFRALAGRGQTAYFSPREMEWARRVREEHSNLRTAVEYCSTELRDHASVMAIVTPLQLYRVGASYVVEEYRWLASALEHDRTPNEIRARALVACSYAASIMGNGDEAEQRALEAADLADALGLPSVAADAACGLARASFYSGDRARTLRLSEAAIARCTASGNLAGACDAFYRAAVTAFGMHDDRAAEFARRSLALAQEYGSPYRIASSLWIEGLCLWRAGDQQLASARLQQALPLYEARGFTGGIAMCCEGLALTAAANGQAEHAATLKGAAHAAWRKAAAPFPQAVVRSLGTDAIDDQVRNALGEARYRAAFDHGAAFSVAEAARFAVGNAPELGSAPAPRKADNAEPLVAESLTRREAEVAALIAEGLSNRQIAERLFIAQRTAEGHVERILAKLGFRSRAKVASWVAQQQRIPD
ncbi:ATP-binding protein [Xylophilus sp. ASV27]|uniref:ATP-binding protein n=1 Tax=Xylophilus sp. ASV27 TaxID=2795129 RepID=UPI0018EA89B2|nr:LuxR C-terminal-related transcriptional regulator [Xylophilus sp. ASV27]